MQIIKQLFFGTLCSVFGIVVSWATFIFILGGDIRGVTRSTILLLQKTEAKLTPIELDNINQLKESDLILSAGELLGHIGSFYSTIIVILITLLTLVTALTFFFVKSSAEERAEKQAKEIASRVIQEKFAPKMQIFDESIKKISDTSIKDILNEQLQIKLFDSLSFSDSLDKKMYRQVEDAIEDSLGTSASELMRENQILTEENLKIKASIQEINQRMDNLEQLYKASENNIVELDSTEGPLVEGVNDRLHDVTNENIVKLGDMDENGN